MTKSEIILELKKQGVVAVIRGYSFEEGYQASKACIQGELKAIESLGKINGNIESRKSCSNG